MPTILPLGDSITLGSEGLPTGYRTFRGTLFRELQLFGITNLDFIGPVNSVPASGGSDGDCAAWGGARMTNTGGNTNNLSSRLASLKSSYPSPTLIHLYIGWNDVYQATPSIGSVFQTLLNDIQSGAWATVPVICCTLHPEPGKTEAQTAGTYAEYGAINAKIRELCAAAPTTRILSDYAAYSGGNQQSFVDTMLFDAQNGPDTLTMLGGAQLPAAYGGQLVTSFKSIEDYNALWTRDVPRDAQGNPYPPPGGTGSIGATVESQDANGNNRFTLSVDSGAVWAWMFCAPGHTATNACIEIRNGFAGVRRRNGSHEFLFQGARFGDALDVSVSWGRGQEPFGNYALGWRPDGITSWYKPDGNIGLEVWPRDTVPSRGIETFVGGRNRNLVSDAAMFYWGFQARLAPIDPNGAFSPSQVRMVAKAGIDYISAFGTSPKYDRHGWPYGVMDGGSDRWKYITSTEWTQVTGISIGKGGPGSTATNSHFEDPGLQPPIANWSPATPYNNIPTYSLSADDIRANPPPMPDFWESTGGTGSGFAEGDYWFNPGINARDIHLNQSGADKLARISAKVILRSNVLGGGGGGGTVSGLLPGLPLRPNVFNRQSASKENVETKEWSSLTAPSWGDFTSLAPAVARKAYFAQLAASGLPAPTYSVVGTKPAWLTVATNGQLTGPAPAAATSYSIVFRASNSEGQSDRTFTLTVAENVAITLEALPVARAGEAWNVTLLATGPGPLTWELLVGQLPSWASLNGPVLSGTPPANVSTSETQLTFSCLGANNLSDTKTFTLQVTAAAVPPAPVASKKRKFFPRFWRKFLGR